MKTERASKAGVPRRGTRVGDKKLSEPVTLFAAIEAEQHEALRAIAFSERRSLADVVREALTGVISPHPTRRRLAPAKPEPGSSSPEGGAGPRYAQPCPRL